MELFFTFISAIVAGTIVGLLPGFGMLNVMIIGLPFLMTLDVTSLLVFYTVTASITQFVGSVVATTTGVPGELSSIPACTEGPKLFEKNQGVQAIAYAAIGSFIGTSIIGVGLLYTLPYISDLATDFYGNTIQTVIFTSVILLMLVTTQNKFIHNFIMMCFGFALALIGTNVSSAGNRYNFGIPALSEGIPLVVLSIACFAIPQILQNFEKLDYTKIKHIPSMSLWEGIRTFPKYGMSSMRGTVIGTFAGLIPGIAFTMASMISYYSEKLLRTKNKTYDTTGDMHSLISAETSNNVAVLVAMVPVFLFGLPIMASEAMLVSLIERTGLNVGFNVLSQTQYFVPTVLLYLLAGVFGLVIAWFAANQILKIFKLPSNLLKTVLLLVLTLSVVYAGITQYSLGYYLVMFALLLPLGIALRKLDTSIILFAFLIFPQLEGSIRRFVLLNF